VLSVSGLYRLDGWAGHHRPQKRLYEYEHEAALRGRRRSAPLFDQVVLVEELCLDGGDGMNDGGFRAWLDVLKGDGGAQESTPRHCVTPKSTSAASKLSNASPRSKDTLNIDMQLSQMGWLEIARRFENALPPSFAFYDEGALAAVSELYASDFETYGYQVLKHL
jgi:hypothetical protein